MLRSTTVCLCYALFLRWDSRKRESLFYFPQVLKYRKGHTGGGSLFLSGRILIKSGTIIILGIFG